MLSTPHPQQPHQGRAVQNRGYNGILAPARRTKGDGWGVLEWTVDWRRGECGGRGVELLVRTSF